MKNNSTKYKVKILETDVKDLKKDMRIVMRNHIPHINESLIRLNTKMTVYTAVNIGGLILAVLAFKFL